MQASDETEQAKIMVLLAKGKGLNEKAEKVLKEILCWKKNQ